MRSKHIWDILLYHHAFVLAMTQDAVRFYMEDAVRDGGGDMLGRCNRGDIGMNEALRMNDAGKIVQWFVGTILKCLLLNARLGPVDEV